MPGSPRPPRPVGTSTHYMAVISTLSEDDRGLGTRSDSPRWVAPPDGRRAAEDDPLTWVPGREARCCDGPVWERGGSGEGRADECAGAIRVKNGGSVLLERAPGRQDWTLLSVATAGRTVALSVILTVGRGRRARSPTATVSRRSLSGRGFCSPTRTS